MALSLEFIGCVYVKKLSNVETLLKLKLTKGSNLSKMAKFLFPLGGISMKFQINMEKTYDRPGHWIRYRASKFIKN